MIAIGIEMLKFIRLKGAFDELCLDSLGKRSLERNLVLRTGGSAADGDFIDVTLNVLAHDYRLIRVE
jgi:hypothetical protein